VLNVTLGRASDVPRELRIIPLEAAVILDLRATEGSNPPHAEPLSVNAARESFQGSLRHLADISVIVIRLLYGLNKV
jgi:hypothetical protein